MLNKIKCSIMLRYCPEYEKRMPKDKPGKFRAEVIISYGYWGNNTRVVASKEVNGFKNAYETARWLALKAQWFRPSWLFGCGVHYGIVPLDYQAVPGISGMSSLQSFLKEMKAEGE
jgi:hypothetical protein